MKRGVIGTPEPSKSAEWGHATSAEVCEALVKSILGGANLKYVGHWYCIREARARMMKARDIGSSHLR